MNTGTPNLATDLDAVRKLIAEYPAGWGLGYPARELLPVMADEIEKLRAALRPFVEASASIYVGENEIESSRVLIESVSRPEIGRARAALGALPSHAGRKAGE